MAHDAVEVQRGAVGGHRAVGHLGGAVVVVGHEGDGIERGIPNRVEVDVRGRHLEARDAGEAVLGAARLGGTPADEAVARAIDRVGQAQVHGFLGVVRDCRIGGAAAGIGYVGRVPSTLAAGQVVSHVVGQAFPHGRVGDGGYGVVAASKGAVGPSKHCVHGQGSIAGSVGHGAEQGAFARMTARRVGYLPTLEGVAGAVGVGQGGLRDVARTERDARAVGRNGYGGAAVSLGACRHAVAVVHVVNLLCGPLGGQGDAGGRAVAGDEVGVGERGEREGAAVVGGAALGNDSVGNAVNPAGEGVAGASGRGGIDVACRVGDVGAVDRQAARYGDLAGVHAVGEVHVVVAELLPYRVEVNACGRHGHSGRIAEQVLGIAGSRAVGAVGPTTQRVACMRDGRVGAQRDDLVGHRVDGLAGIRGAVAGRLVGRVVAGGERPRIARTEVVGEQLRVGGPGGRQRDQRNRVVIACKIGVGDSAQRVIGAGDQVAAAIAGAVEPAGEGEACAGGRGGVHGVGVGDVGRIRGHALRLNGAGGVASDEGHRVADGVPIGNERQLFVVVGVVTLRQGAERGGVAIGSARVVGRVGAAEHRVGLVLDGPAAEGVARTRRILGGVCSAAQVHRCIPRQVVLRRGGLVVHALAVCVEVEANLVGALLRPGGRQRDGRNAVVAVGQVSVGDGRIARSGNGARHGGHVARPACEGVAVARGRSQADVVGRVGQAAAVGRHAADRISGIDVGRGLVHVHDCVVARLCPVGNQVQALVLGLVLACQCAEGVSRGGQERDVARAQHRGGCRVGCVVGRVYRPALEGVAGAQGHRVGSTAVGGHLNGHDVVPFNARLVGRHVRRRGGPGIACGLAHEGDRVHVLGAPHRVEVYVGGAHGEAGVAGEQVGVRRRGGVVLPAGKVVARAGHGAGQAQVHRCADSGLYLGSRVGGAAVGQRVAGRVVAGGRAPSAVIKMVGHAEHRFLEHGNHGYGSRGAGTVAQGAHRIAGGRKVGVQRGCRGAFGRPVGAVVNVPALEVVAGTASGAQRHAVGPHDTGRQRGGGKRHFGGIGRIGRVFEVVGLVLEVRVEGAGGRRGQLAGRSIVDARVGYRGAVGVCPVVELVARVGVGRGAQDGLVFPGLGVARAADAALGGGVAVHRVGDVNGVEGEERVEVERGAADDRGHDVLAGGARRIRGCAVGPTDQRVARANDVGRAEHGGLLARNDAQSGRDAARDGCGGVEGRGRLAARGKAARVLHRGELQGARLRLPEGYEGEVRRHQRRGGGRGVASDVQAVVVNSGFVVEVVVPAAGLRVVHAPAGEGPARLGVRVADVLAVRGGAIHRAGVAVLGGGAGKRNRAVLGNLRVLHVGVRVGGILEGAVVAGVVLHDVGLSPPGLEDDVLRHDIAQRVGNANRRAYCSVEQHVPAGQRVRCAVGVVGDAEVGERGGSRGHGRGDHGAVNHGVAAGRLRDAGAGAVSRGAGGRVDEVHGVRAEHPGAHDLYVGGVHRHRGAGDVRAAIVGGEVPAVEGVAGEARRVFHSKGLARVVGAAVERGEQRGAGRRGLGGRAVSLDVGVCYLVRVGLVVQLEHVGGRVVVVVEVRNVAARDACVEREALVGRSRVLGIGGGAYGVYDLVLRVAARDGAHLVEGAQVVAVFQEDAKGDGQRGARGEVRRERDVVPGVGAARAHGPLDRLKGLVDAVAVSVGQRGESRSAVHAARLHNAVLVDVGVVPPVEDVVGGGAGHDGRNGGGFKRLARDEAGRRVQRAVAVAGRPGDGGRVLGPLAVSRERLAVCRCVGKRVLNGVGAGQLGLGTGVFVGDVPAGEGVAGHGRRGRGQLGRGRLPRIAGRLPCERGIARLQLVPHRIRALYVVHVVGAAGNASRHGDGSGGGSGPVAAGSRVLVEVVAHIGGLTVFVTVVRERDYGVAGHVGRRRGVGVEGLGSHAVVVLHEHVLEVVRAPLLPAGDEVDDRVAARGTHVAAHDVAHGRVDVCGDAGAVDVGGAAEVAHGPAFELVAAAAGNVAARIEVVVARFRPAVRCGAVGGCVAVSVGVVVLVGHHVGGAVPDGMQRYLGGIGVVAGQLAVGVACGNQVHGLGLGAVYRNARIPAAQRVTAAGDRRVPERGCLRVPIYGGVGNGSRRRVVLASGRIVCHVAVRVEDDRVVYGRPLGVYGDGLVRGVDAHVGVAGLAHCQDGVVDGSVHVLHGAADGSRACDSRRVGAIDEPAAEGEARLLRRAVVGLRGQRGIGPRHEARSGRAREPGNAFVVVAVVDRVVLAGLGLEVSLHQHIGRNRVRHDALAVAGRGGGAEGLRVAAAVHEPACQLVALGHGNGGHATRGDGCAVIDLVAVGRVVQAAYGYDAAHGGRAVGACARKGDGVGVRLEIGVVGAVGGQHVRAERHDCARERGRIGFEVAIYVERPVDERVGPSRRCVGGGRMVGDALMCNGIDRFAGGAGYAALACRAAANLVVEGDGVLVEVRVYGYAAIRHVYGAVERVDLRGVVADNPADLRVAVADVG